MDPDMVTGIAEYAKGLGEGLGDFFASKNKAKAYGYAAQQASQEAGVATSQALTAGDRVLAHAATQSAANGGGFVGSTMAQLGDLAGQSMFRARAAAYRGATEVQADRYDQKLAKRAGVMSLVSAVAGPSLLGGWAKSQANARQAQAMAKLRNPYLEDAGGTPNGPSLQASVDTMNASNDAMFGGSSELAGLY